MPIHPDQKHRYPDDWEKIAAWVKFVRADGRCECTGECGRTLDHLLPVDARCRNRHGEPKWSHSGVGTLVILTTAHLDHVPENVDEENLRAFCPGCHLQYDQLHHQHSKSERRIAAMGLVPLFELGDLVPAL